MTRTSRLTDLLNRIRSGDRDAWAALGTEFRSELEDLIRYRLRASGRAGSAFRVSDLCQSLLVSLPDRLKNAALIDDGTAWVGAAVRNLVIDKGRRLRCSKRGGQCRAAGHAALDAVCAPTPPPPDVLVGREEVAAATAALDTLSADDREVVDRRLGDETWDQIAESRGERANTLGRRIRRRLRELSARLFGGDPG